MKKIISLLVVLTMLLGVLSGISVSADTTPTAITPDTSWYDGDTAHATNSTFVLEDAADLLGFAKIMAENSSRPFAGDTIELAANIDLNPGWDASTGEAPTNVWPDIQYNFAGTFDGKGHMISGIYQNSTTKGGYAGIFGGTWGYNVEVKNLIISNSWSQSNQMQGHGFLFGFVSNATNLTIDNVLVSAYVVNTSANGGDYGIGGLIGGYQSNDANVGITLKNSVFAGGIVFNGTATGQRYYAGGLVGRYNAKSSNVIEDCAFYGAIVANIVDGSTLMAGKMVGYQSCAGSNLTIKNSVASGSVALYEGAYTPATNGSATGIIFGEIVAAARYNKGFSTVAFENVLYTGNNALLGCGYQQGTAIWTSDATDAEIKYYADSIVKDPAPVTVAVTDANITGTAASTVITANGLTNWVAVDDGPILPKTIVDGTVEEEPEQDIPLDITVPDNADISWYKSTQSEFVLEDEADLLGYAYIITKFEKIFEGKTVKLAKDMDLNPGWDANAETVEVPAVIWPVSGGEAKTKIAGTFDGQGHTIKGLYVSATIERAGLMGFVPEGVYAAIKNVNIVNSYITSTQDGVGGLLGATYSANTTVISNVYCDAKVVCTATKGNLLGVGGIIGGATWSKSSTYNLTIENTVYAGDIVSSFTESAYASDGTPGANVGGIMGFSNTLTTDAETSKHTMTIKNTAFYGTITGVMPKDGNVGGIFGMMKANGINLYNCISAGTIDVEGISLGFVGSVYGDVGPAATAVVENCLYTGEIGAGGFFELPEGAIAQISDVATIKGAAASAVLTANNMTDWSATDDAYPLPTTLKAQVAGIDVPTNAPVDAPSTPTTPGGSNNSEKDDKDDEEETEAPSETTEDSTENVIDEKKGCGGTVLGGMAIVLVAAGAAVTVGKKKRD